MYRFFALVLAALLTACSKEATDSWQGYIEGEFVLLASRYAGQLQKPYVRRGDRVEAAKPVFALGKAKDGAAAVR
jgi:HlyD family secretion protein